MPFPENRERHKLKNIFLINEISLIFLNYEEVTVIGNIIFSFGG